MHGKILELREKLTEKNRSAILNSVFSYVVSKRPELRYVLIKILAECFYKRFSCKKLSLGAENTGTVRYRCAMLCKNKKNIYRTSLSIGGD
jgi:hypothetical protein